MAGASAPFFISLPNGVARPLRDFVPSAVFLPGSQQPPLPPPGPNLPLSPDGMLVPGQIYPDASDPSITWYLPVYALNVAGGRYTTSLKWRGPGDDPNGPLAFLEVELAAPVPAGAASGVREISHTATVRLLYALAVQTGVAPTDPGVPVPDPGTPTPAPTAMIAVEIGALSVQPSGIRTCRLPITTKPDFDRIYAALTDATLQGHLEIHCTAVVGHNVRRILPPIPVDPPQPFDIPHHPFDIPHHPFDIAVPDTVQTPPHPPGNGEAILPTLERAALPTAFEAKQVAPAEPAVLFAPTSIGELRLQSLVEGPTSIVLQHDAQQTGVEIFRRPTLPPVRFGVVLERIPAETVETLGFVFPIATNAYMFDIPGDLTPTSHEILIPNTVTVDGVVTNFYQDSAFPDRYYFQPQEFRLTRSDVPPHLPSIAFAFDPKPPAADAPAGAPVDYEVHLAFRAVPWISPLAMFQVRQQVPDDGPAPHFLPLAPLSASLTLNVPADPPTGATVASAQPMAAITFDQVLADEVMLSPERFKALSVNLIHDAVDGTVDATLVGSAMVSVPVHLALATAFDHAFGRSLQAGSGGTGTYTVTLTNQIESPVTIAGVRASEVAPRVLAIPGAITPGTVAPGQSIRVDYSIQPPDATVLDIEPDLDMAVATDATSLLPMLMAKEGYRSDTFSVNVAISADYFARPAEDGSILQQVLVEFDCGASVILTSANSSQPVTLQMPWLPFLLEEPEAKQYRYRVTDVWRAEPSPIIGAPGSWQSGEGEADLAIMPNPPDPSSPSPSPST
jgi:hypothetical protein